MNKAKRKFTAVYQKSEGWYVGRVKEVPGAVSQGRTLKELKENLEEAAQLILEVNAELAAKGGKAAKIREPIEVSL